VSDGGQLLPAHGRFRVQPSLFDHLAFNPEEKACGIGGATSSSDLSLLSLFVPVPQMFAKVFLFLALIAVAAAFAPRSPIARKSSIVR